MTQTAWSFFLIIYLWNLFGTWNLDLEPGICFKPF
jgi:hypothetical protein